MYQRIIIIGRLGADPVQRFTPNGTPVTSFSVATDRAWTDESGGAQKRTVWFRVSAWRKLGEICGKYLAKGRMVMVEGEMVEPKPYQATNGDLRASLDVTAREVKFLSSKSDGESQEATAEAEPIDDEDQIPF